MCNTQFSTTRRYLLLLSCQVQKLRCARNSWQFMFGHNESFGFLSLSRWLYSAIDSIDIYRPYFCLSAPLQWTFCYTQRGFWRVRRVWWRCTEQILWWRGGMPGKHPTVKHHFDPNCCILMHLEHFLTCDITSWRVQSLDGGRDRAGGRRPKGHRGWLCNLSWQEKSDMAMNQYLLIPFLVGWTSIYQLFWCSLGTRVLTQSQICYHHRRHRQVAPLRSLVNCNGKDNNRWCAGTVAANPYQQQME